MKYKMQLLALICALILSAGCAAPAASSSTASPASSVASSEAAPSEAAPSESASSEAPAQADPIPMPEIDGTDLDGNPLPDDLLLKDGVTMINIWATFCAPCIDEMPDLGEISREYQEAGKKFKMIGICSDAIDFPAGTINEKNLALAKEIVEKTNADYQHVIPGENLMTNLLPAVSAVPTTFFVDGDGNIIGALPGARPKDEWVELIDSLL